MFSKIKDVISNFFSSRLRVIMTIMVLFAAILIVRLFVLQIINGESYQENYNLKIEKTESIAATRGCIYDRNGNLLAYNKLANSITIQDSGSYDSTREKNESLNSEIYQIVVNLEKNGDAIDNSFGIRQTSSGKYEFSSTSETTINRFRADVFGYASADDLSYNEDLGIDEATATATQIMEYLMGEDCYDISTSYEEKYRYEICVIRYAMAQNSYQKYISTTIASDVSDETVAYIEENINDLTGVDVEETSIRYYVDSKYFANILGYTGTISTEEYEEAYAEDDTVEMTDVVGKSGIEQVMNDELSGTKGYQTVYVDKVGNVLSVSEQTDAIPGNDVYLSIDKDLQIATYEALENQIASILYSKIQNVKTYNSSEDEDSSDIIIPVYDVYYAFIDNGMIDTDAFSNEDASDTEKEVLAAYESKKETVLSTLQSQLTSSSPSVYSDLSDEYQAYSTYIVTELKSLDIIDSDAIDSSDEMQQLWTSESLSINEYLQYVIEQNWIDVTKFANDSKYSDTEEIYDQLVDYIIDYLSTDADFENLIYKYLILEDSVSGNQLCAILYEQGYLEEDEETKNALLSGSISAYSFVLEAIQTKLITPGELGLDPCSGSAVVIDTDTGEVLALVSYPGYDNNKLANTVDSTYYYYLSTNDSNPLYNHATQQRTAPGSTFKIVTSTAALAENLITTSTEIEDEGVFEKVSNNPRCWIYPSNHGSINLSEAIRYSCNYFFYELGYELAGSSNYSDEAGIQTIQEYASMFGLNSKTGIEIDETTSTIATEYPVMAAIGQSDNNITTIALARYVTAIANQGTVYNLTLLDHVQNPVTDETVATYSPEVKNQITCLDSSEWAAIASGMRGVVEDQSAFSTVEYEAAGKTGTAQQDTSRPNHALFIGYAPYDDPEIAVATRIAYGYSSSNAAQVAANIMSYYFGEITLDSLLSNEIATTTTTNTFSD